MQVDNTKYCLNIGSYGWSVQPIGVNRGKSATVFSCHHLHLPFTTYSNIGWSVEVQKPVCRCWVTRQHPRAVAGYGAGAGCPECGGRRAAALAPIPSVE